MMSETKINFFLFSFFGCMGGEGGRDYPKIDKFVRCAFARVMRTLIIIIF